MTSNGQPVPPPANHGRLMVDVWPTYIGMGESTDGVTLSERAGDPDYQRGQISWEAHPDGTITGRARVQLPKGIYTHLMFCHGPVEHLIGVEQFEHPVVFDRPGFFDVDPIVNKDYMPRPT
jgi:hypothetical protein